MLPVTGWITFFLNMRECIALSFSLASAFSSTLYLHMHAMLWPHFFMLSLVVQVLKLIAFLQSMWCRCKDHLLPVTEANNFSEVGLVGGRRISRCKLVTAGSFCLLHRQDSIVQLVGYILPLRKQIPLFSLGKKVSLHFTYLKWSRAYFLRYLVGSAKNPVSILNWIGQKNIVCSYKTEQLG